MDIKQQTYQLIDDLKAVCHSKGLGNDGNEYKENLDCSKVKNKKKVVFA